MSNWIVSSNFWFLITSITEEQTPVHTPFLTTRLNVAISDLTSRRTGAERPALYFNYNTGNRPTINLIKTFTTQQPLPSPSPSPQQYSRMCVCSVLRQFVAFYNVFTSVLLCPITATPTPPPLKFWKTQSCLTHFGTFCLSKVLFDLVGCVVRRPPTTNLQNDPHLPEKNRSFQKVWPKCVI